MRNPSQICFTCMQKSICNHQLHCFAYSISRLARCIVDIYDTRGVLTNTVGINAFEKTISCMEHLINVVDLLVMIADLVVNDAAEHEQALGIV